MMRRSVGPCLLIAVALLSACKGGGGRDLTYHVGRFWGLAVDPNRSIIEGEITRAAKAKGVRESVLKALVRVESGGNHKALSRKGARGIAQIMPANAKRCGLRSAEKLWDPVHNLRCGAQILAEEIREHGDLEKALTVYNCGRVKCPEGKQYAQKVLALSRHY